MFPHEPAVYTVHYGHRLHLVRCQTVTFLIEPIPLNAQMCAATCVCPQTGPEDTTGAWTLTGPAQAVTHCLNKQREQHTVKIRLQYAYYSRALD